MLGTCLVLVLLRSVESVVNKNSTSLKIFQFLALHLNSDQ